MRASLATASPEALSVFNDRLLDASFMDGTPNEFDAWGFTPRQSEVFAVGDGFPRLLESGLPPGVSEVSYTLNLSAAAPFQIAYSDFWARVTSSYG